VLRERLEADLKTALKEHDQTRLSVIGLVKAAVLAEETKGPRRVLDDDGILAVIAREIKERLEARAQFERGGRADLVAQVERELAVLREYMPPPLSETELDALVDDAVRRTGASGPKDMGRVMAVLMPAVRGRADGRVVSEKVRTRLAPS
jgi:uncharacterized protein YqeY